MINRKALLITSLLVIAMIVANIWRLSLLPDWRHVPAEVAGNIRIIPVFWTFLPPLTVLLMMGIFFAVSWLRSGPEEAVQPWGLYYGRALVFFAGIMALAQAFNLAHSLGALQSVNQPTFSHVILAATGIFMMVTGNMLPKMPWLSARFRYFQLDPWQWNQQVRFAGKLTVALGLFMAVGMPLLSRKMDFLATLGLTLAFVAVNYWHRAKVRRESSRPAGHLPKEHLS